MKTRIIDEILLRDYYNSANTCEECEHTVNKNDNATYVKKKEALDQMLVQVAQSPFDTGKYQALMNECKNLELEEVLSELGKFEDIGETYEDALLAIRRLACIIEIHHWKIGKPWKNKESKRRVLRAIAHYCRKEADRKDQGYSRFHDSIFMFPTCAINCFMGLLPDMRCVEVGEEDDETREAYRELLRVGMQPWLLPLRNDHTDEHPISVERFRKHVHWVGGNALSYRPVFYSALMFRSVEMMDCIVYIMTHMLTPVSAANLDSAFWCEGICTDGFGWGHGRQTYNNGYPLNSVETAIEMMRWLKGTEWYDEIANMDFKWLLSFIRAITWGVYQDMAVPMMGRYMYRRTKMQQLDKHAIDHTLNIMEKLLMNHSKLLDDEVLKEFQEVLKGRMLEYHNKNEYPYAGVRYFWNNDALIKKNAKSYVYVNMASARCDGVECADIMGDTRNFYVADGSYVIMSDGDEYRDAMGTWQASMLPGVTTRELWNHEIMTETNWHGYNSIHHYAGGVFRGNCGACGFIYEKDGKRKADGAGVINHEFTKAMLGVLAYKSYFILEDTLVCLGAGITDKKPTYGKKIRTTIDNTKWKTDVKLYDSNGYQVECITSELEQEIAHNHYIKHHKLLYGLLDDNRIQMSLAQKQTDWASRNFCNQNVEDIICPILELHIDHGVSPVAESYSYFIYSGHLHPKEYIDKQLIKVVENTTRLQAIESKDGFIGQAIFYEKLIECEFSRFKVQVSSPSVIMVEEEKAGYYCTVCDVLQDVQLRYIIVTLWMDNKKVEKKVPLNNSLEVGKSVTLWIERDEVFGAKQDVFFL